MNSDKLKSKHAYKARKQFSGEIGSSFVSMGNQAEWEMRSSNKVFIEEPEDLRSDPQYIYAKLGMATCVYNAST